MTAQTYSHGLWRPSVIYWLATETVVCEPPRKSEL